MTQIVTDAQARAERIRQGVAQVKSWLGDVMAAHAAQDWNELGYESWGAYCDDVIGARIQLPRGERKEITFTMAQAGMSTRAIGAALGRHHDTVADDLKARVGNPTPARGLDGKTYERKPRPEPETIRVNPETGEILGEAECIAQDNAASDAKYALRKTPEWRMEQQANFADWLLSMQKTIERVNLLAAEDKLLRPSAIDMLNEISEYALDTAGRLDK